MAKLENIEVGAPASIFSAEDATLLRRQLTEGAGVLRDSLERVRHIQEDLDITKRRRDEAESRLAALEAEYEELLGTQADDLQLCIANKVGVYREDYS